MIENIDPFKVMKMLGVKDELYCLDMVNGARNEVLKVKQIESEAK